jgi:hypothetical protein
VHGCVTASAADYVEANTIDKAPDRLKVGLTIIALGQPTHVRETGYDVSIPLVSICAFLAMPGHGYARSW